MGLLLFLVSVPPVGENEVKIYPPSAMQMGLQLVEAYIKEEDDLDLNNP
jgi:hypothetical protein